MRQWPAAVLMLINVHAHAAANDPFDFDLNATQPTTASSAWQWAGYIETRNQYLPLQHSYLSTRVSGQLELKWSQTASAGTQWRAYASVRGEHDEQTRHYRSSWRHELREAYLLRDGSRFDLTIGKQRVAWGTADGVSTIDRLNAVDLRDPIGNARTSSRRPSWLIRAEQTLAVGVLEAVWLPRGKDVKLPEFGSPWEPAFLNTLRQQRSAGLIELEIQDVQRDQGGVRYQYFGQGIDFSVAWFNGYTDGPVQLDIEETALAAPELTLRPVRTRTLAMGSAIGLGNSTLRGEIAHTPDTLVDGRKGDLWQLVVGWDRTFFTNLYANVQLFWDEAEAGADTHGMTFSISDNILDDAGSIGLRGQYANDDQYAVEIFMDVSYGDRLKLTGKYLAFGGQPDSPTFDYARNDFLELTLRWEF